MAIIGILAGTILVGVSGQREKARAGRAMQSMSAVLPYAIECYIAGTSMTPPDVTGGEILCGTINYPEIGDGCSYGTVDPDISGTIIGTCGSHTITCYIQTTGNCLET